MGDLRTGGSWTRRQRLKNALIRATIRAVLPLVDRTPPRLLVVLGRALGALVWCASPALRRAARLNLEHAGLPDRAVARRSFIRAGENLALCSLLRRRDFHVGDHVEIDAGARAVLEAAHASGSGVLFVSAHLGPFELVAAAIAELGYRPAVLVRESYDPALDDVVDQHRHRRQIEVIHRGRATATARILRALRAGRPVGLLPDLGGRVRSAPLEFLGGRVSFPIGPARIARRARAHVVVGTLSRKLASRAEPQPGFTLRIVNLGVSDNELELTRRITAELANAIAERPDDWLWMGARIRTLQENSTNG